MTYMATVPDKFFDLAIVDPPYGIGAASKNGGVGGINKNGNTKWKNQSLNNYVAKDWDSIKPDAGYFNELKRVSKDIIIWGGNYFSSMLSDSSGWIVWDKQTSGNFSDCEIAYTTFKMGIRKFTWLWNGFQKQHPEERIHPTQKPVQLYKWLLHNYAKPGDKILDTHGGSMSIAIACHQMGFDLVLTEIDKDYYDAGVKRFKEQTLQGDLFK